MQNVLDVFSSRIRMLNENNDMIYQTEQDKSTKSQIIKVKYNSIVQKNAPLEENTWCLVNEMVC